MAATAAGEPAGLHIDGRRDVRNHAADDEDRLLVGVKRLVKGAVSRMALVGTLYCGAGAAAVSADLQQTSVQGKRNRRKPWQCTYQIASGIKLHFAAYYSFL